jgi:hypothetical protein
VKWQDGWMLGWIGASTFPMARPSSAERPALTLRAVLFEYRSRFGHCSPFPCQLGLDTRSRPTSALTRVMRRRAERSACGPPTAANSCRLSSPDLNDSLAGAMGYVLSSLTFLHTCPDSHVGILRAHGNGFECAHPTILSSIHDMPGDGVTPPSPFPSTPGFGCPRKSCGRPRGSRRVFGVSDGPHSAEQRLGVPSGAHLCNVRPSQGDRPRLRTETSAANHAPGMVDRTGGPGVLTT